MGGLAMWCGLLATVTAETSTMQELLELEALLHPTQGYKGDGDTTLQSYLPGATIFDTVDDACGCCMKYYNKPQCAQWNGNHKTCMWTGCNSAPSAPFNGMRRNPMLPSKEKADAPDGRLLRQGGGQPRDKGKICWSCSDMIGTPCTIEQLKKPCPMPRWEAPKMVPIEPSPTPPPWNDNITHYKYVDPPIVGGPRATSGEASVHLPMSELVANHSSSPLLEETKCEDTAADCAGWAEDGACDSHKGYMQVSCKKSCNLC